MSVIVSVGRPATIQGLYKSSGVASVSGDLQERLQKYERKAANYKTAAEQAKSGADRALYQGLAGYCDDLVAQFREVIAKRADPLVAAE
jgi:hypothetical protein